MIDAKLIAARIKELRNERGLSQQKVSMDYHVSKSTWSNYERGTRKITLELIAYICEAWGVSADYLLFGETNRENYIDLSGLSPSHIHDIKEIVNGLRRG